MLRPEVSGRVASINFVEGGPVAKVPVLVELDSSVERAELAQAQAQQVLARSNFERAKELRRNNAGTQRALTRPTALRTANVRWSTSLRRDWTSASWWRRSTRAPACGP